MYTANIQIEILMGNVGDTETVAADFESNFRCLAVRHTGDKQYRVSQICTMEQSY